MADKEQAARPEGQQRKPRDGRRGRRGAPLPRIFFCGDPHGEFDHINEAAVRYKPEAMILLGDIQPPGPVEEILAAALSVTQVWWIPGNHDSDTEEFYDRLWKGPLAERNLHGKVQRIAGIRIAGLGGVFRGQIWMPDVSSNYHSVASFLRRNGRNNLWRGGLPRRHRTSIFPTVYDNLAKQRADVLVTHEAASCHKKGFEAIDKLAQSLHARWHFHGHQHEDRAFGRYRGVITRAVGFRGIVDLHGNAVVEAQIDPRDLFAMQSAGLEPPPEVFDAVLSGQPLPRVAPRPPEDGEDGAGERGECREGGCGPAQDGED
ncbi:MAG: metallophosphoesterase [Duodenibacillus sp.]|nr:metallophosphoesterase [Duodenibacillus sp.]